VRQYLEGDDLLKTTSEILKVFKSNCDLAQFQSDRLKAVVLYNAVRDGIIYNPFNINLNFEEYSTDKVITSKQGHCIDKAALLIALLRSEKIPARFGLARVKNHIGTSKLEKILRTDVLVPHGYTEVYLNDKWVKCTPAFNSALCQKLGVSVLDWDGLNDSVFQSFDTKSNQFMEYLNHLGTFSSLPMNKIKSWMQKEYPHMFNPKGEWMAERLLVD